MWKRESTTPTNPSQNFSVLYKQPSFTTYARVWRVMSCAMVVQVLIHLGILSASRWAFLQNCFETPDQKLETVR